MGNFGIKAIIQQDKEHVLGFQTARVGDGNFLLDLWNGASEAARAFAVLVGGRTRHGDGTEALPGIAFVQDPDSGLYRIGANNVGLAVGGTKVMDAGSDFVRFPGGIRLANDGIANILSGSTTWDPPSIADGAVTSQNVTVTGATTADFALASLSTNNSGGGLISAHVTATNTVTVVLFNKSGGSLDLPSGNLLVLVLQFG